jgi:predicted Zn-dependent protease
MRLTISKLALLAALITAISGCAGGMQERPLVVWRTETTPIEEADQPRQPESEEYARENPRSAASLQLTKQGQALLQNGRPDDAISTLERSIGLDPKNGLSYYWLAEAWYVKRNLSQAQEFNRLAGLYFKNDPAWIARVQEQRERILSTSF